MKKIRRVVTGHSSDGKSVRVTDAAPPRVVSKIAGLPGTSITAVWATDNGMTAVPGSDDPTPAMTTFVPGHGGTRFLVTVFPPEKKGAARRTTSAATRRALLATLPGLAESMEASNPGMHTTDTVDYDIIIAGELWLELDDGKQVHLRPGDIVVQNGTRHAWRNKGTRACTMYSVLVGAPRR